MSWMGYSKRHPFWYEECPARGPLLTHHHDTADTVTDHSVCSFCGRFAGQQATPAPLDIGQRLMDMGFPKPSEHYDDQIIEPKMITGEGPKGPLWERGRGELSTRDKSRLIFSVKFPGREISAIAIDLHCLGCDQCKGYTP